MDAFGIDLDKVLDDFEKDEDTVSPQANFNHHISKASEVLPPSYHEVKSADLKEAQECSHQNNHTLNSECSQPTLINNDDNVAFPNITGTGIFDLSEGLDLPTNIQRLENMNNGAYTDEKKIDLSGDEGHFIPDDAEPDVSGSPLCLDNGALINNAPHPMANNGFSPQTFYANDADSEIMQAASELEAHIGDKEDRPSFMSSSPPPLSAYTHPDIIVSSSSSSEGSSEIQSENQSDSGVSCEQGDGNILSDSQTSPIHRTKPSADALDFSEIDANHSDHLHKETVYQDIPNSDYYNDNLSRDCVESTDVSSNHNQNQASLDNSLVSDITVGEYSLQNTGIPGTEVRSGKAASLDISLAAQVPDINDDTTPTNPSLNIEESFTSCMDSVNAPVESTRPMDQSDQQICDDTQNNSQDATPVNTSTVQELFSNTGTEKSKETETNTSVKSDEADLNITDAKIISNDKIEPVSNEDKVTSMEQNKFDTLTIDDMAISEADLHAVSAQVESEMEELERELAQMKQENAPLEEWKTVNATSEANLTNNVTAQNVSNVGQMTSHADSNNELLTSMESSLATKSQEGAITISDNQARAINATGANNKDQNLASSSELSGHKNAASVAANSTTITLQSQSQSSIKSVPSSDTLSPDTPSGSGFEKRRGSGESVERFLAPSILSPGIATPMDDPGFTKVPGFQPALGSTTEVEENQVTKPTSATTAAGNTDIVRPKESTPERTRKRPDSLLGLSKPDLPAARVVSDCMSDDSIEIKRPPVNSDLRSNQIPTAVISPTSYDQPCISNPNILRPKTLIPAHIMSTDSTNNAIQLASSTVQQTFPLSQQATRPSSWPVPDNSNTTTTNPAKRRPTSLNIPPRSGSISPSQHMVTSPFSPEASETTDVSEAMDSIESNNVSKTTVTTAKTISDDSSIAQNDDASMPSETTLQAETTVPSETTPSAASVERAMEAAENAVASHSNADAGGATGVTLSASKASLISEPSITSPGSTPGTVLPPPSSSNPLFAITDLGKIKPDWVPDVEAPECMECDLKFTFTKRRHHCRACGKVFCSNCCSLKSKLQYLDNKEARVCSKCYQDLIRAVVFERMAEQGNSMIPPPSPNPSNPELASGPEVAEAVPTVPPGIMRGPESQRRGQRNVSFPDGVPPGGDLSEDAQPSTASRPSSRRTRNRPANPRRVVATSQETKVLRVPQVTNVSDSYVPSSGLPPVFMGVGQYGEFILETTASASDIMVQINAGEKMQFALNKNLIILVKHVSMDCCMNKSCWCFTSQGMYTVGQDEVVILLEVFPDEDVLPRDIFKHYQALYEEASQGQRVSHLDHTIFSQGFLESRDHGGMLYVRPSFQCLNQLLIPQSSPYVFGILLQKWETPWAKVFPLRLLLRLGAEFRYYPCPLVSVRFRTPVFGEIGHTIMTLLVDFQNFSYAIPRVRGLTILMRDKRTYLSLPRNRYDDVTRALSSNSEQVLALAAIFSKEADSYLVCLQNDEGNYQTQAINIHNKPRKVTGASFVVFNANLKSSGGVTAKSSIVEDGLMVQILPETMTKLRDALRQMTDFTIEYGGTGQGEPEESVVIQWADNDKEFNVGVVSPIDGFPLEGVPYVHIYKADDYVGDANKALRWTQVFFLQTNEDTARIEPVDLSRFAEQLCPALCIALAPSLGALSEAGLLRIGLRATIGDNAGYEVGSNGCKLPDMYMNALDNELIPVIHGAGASSRDGNAVVELLFHIINA